MLLDSCFTEAGFTLILRPRPEPSFPQSDTVELTAKFILSHARQNISPWRLMLGRNEQLIVKTQRGSHVTPRSVQKMEAKKYHKPAIITIDA